MEPLKIKNRRKELKLTLEQVGDSVGVSKTTVRRWEQGITQDITTKSLKLLAKTLRVDIDYLLNEEASNLNTEKPDEDIDALLKQHMPLYTSELSNIILLASQLNKSDQQLALRLIKAIKGADDVEKINY